MRCGRCSGLMVVEPISDTTGSVLSGEPLSTRCLNCGNVEDAVIFTNRLEPRSISNAIRHQIRTDVESSSVKTMERGTLAGSSRRCA